MVHWLRGSALALLLPIGAFAQASDQAERARAISELRTYDGKVVKLRRFCRNSAMNFDAAGTLNCPSPGRSWTLDGVVRVKNADIRDGLLRLEGTRVYAIYNTQANHFDYLPTDEKVKVTAPLDSGPITVNTLSVAMSRVLLRTGEPYPEDGTSYWRIFSGAANPAVANAPPPQGVTRVGGPVKPPKLVDTREPEYTEVARERRYEGTVVLWVVVGSDGRVHDIAIKRPAGLGLDEQAIAAVSKWKFQPATKDGNPVAVQVDIEVNFRLYR